MTSNGEGINISYRLDGKESNRTQNGKTTYYAYDKIGQLTSERTGNISTSYTYDGWGNRATKAVGNDITSYEYDRTNRLMSETVSELGAAKKVTEYEYDPNGNLTFKGIGTFADQTDEMTAEVYTNGVEDLATFYTYDAKNRLVGVNSDSGITSYTYDAAGRRKSKTVNGETTKHIWDGDNIVADTTGDNALIAKYYRGVNPVAMVTKSSGALTPYYYHYDEKGSITKLTDKGGKTVQDYTYDAFGNLGTEDDALYNPIRYTGQYTDSETGLIYLRNRYYDPTIGRFTQEDPYWNVHNMVYGNKEFKEDEVKIPDYSAIMQSTNLYVYCMSDPVNGVDLFGTIDWREASDIISRNAWAIKNAGAYYGVNPGIIASCIYTEQILNVNWVDNLTDLYGYWGDTSIGIGQIKVSTAKFLEDAGYIMSTSWAYSYEDWHSNWYVVKDVWYAPAYGYVEGSREWAIANRLTVESENVNYVAAYLAYWQDRWRDVYPEIDGRTAVLATLFNQGELKPPHSNPQPNPFGEQAKKEYAYMRELLGLD